MNYILEVGSFYMPVGYAVVIMYALPYFRLWA